MKLSKKKFLGLSLLVTLISCSQGQPINRIYKVEKNPSLEANVKSRVNIDVKGQVDWNKTTNSLRTKASVNDIATSSTVSLIYPYNHPTNPNKVIATGLTDSAGVFTIKVPTGFIPEINTTYILEVSKRVGGAKNSLMSLRTYIKRNSGDNGWESITTPSININSKTTALSIISALEFVPPEKTIGTMSVSNNITIPSNITVSPLKISYVRKETENIMNVYVINADGSGIPVKVSSDSSRYDIPIISDDGNKIVYSGDDGVTSRIYVANTDGSTTGGYPKIISTTSTDNSYSNFSNDSSKVVYSGYDGTTSQIYIANTNGSTVGGYPKIISTNSTNNTYPIISYDGKKVIYYGGDSIPTFQIYIANTDGSGSPVKLSYGSTNNRYQAISNDQKKIVYQGIKNGVYGIFIANVDGSTTGGYPKQIYSGSSATNSPYPRNYASFSDDSSKIIFQDNSGLYVINSDGSNIYSIPNAYNGSFLNESSKVIYTKHDGVTSRIYVANTDGSTIDGYPKIISTTSTDNNISTSSSDGSKILYSGNDINDVGQTYIANSDGSAAGGYPKSVLDNSNTSWQRFGGGKVISTDKINDLANLVNNVLTANYDPLRFIGKNGESYITTYPQ